MQLSFSMSAFFFPLVLLLLPLLLASAQQQLRQQPTTTTKNNNNKNINNVAYVSPDGNSFLAGIDLSSLTGAQNASIHALQEFLVSRGALESGPAGRRQLQAAGTDTNSMLFPLVQVVLDPRGTHDRSPSKHWLFPACGFAEPIIESPGYCPLGWLVENGAEVNYALNRRGFINVRTIYGTEKEPAQAFPHLPVRMADVGHPLPFRVENASVIESERHTVYWYYRNIINFYGYVKRCVEADTDKVDPPPLIPAGYYGQRFYNTPDEREDNNPPVGQSFMQGEHFVFTMRGTIFRGGFVQDETFGYANPQDVAPSGLHGRLHEGFFSPIMDLVCQLQDELDKHPQIKVVSITGHSLGAAFSQLIAPILALRYPHIEFEAWNLGAPPVGDCDFVKQYNSLPNLRARNLMYLGNGLMTNAPTPFGVGDVIPQAPAMCWPVHGCPFTHHPDVNVRVKYEPTGGIVAFYSKDMPNTAAWNDVDQVVSQNSSPSAAHGCSYLCWAIQGLDDPEDRCYFSDNNHPFPCPYTRLDNN